MQKSNQPVVNFNKGLITEANPLVQPVGSTTDEVNFTLEQDGSRKRRLGMDFEYDFSEHAHPLQTTLDVMGHNTFRWDLTSTDNSIFIVVVQLGNELTFFESNASALSGNKLGSVTVDEVVVDKAYSLTQVNNALIVATGTHIYSISYEFSGSLHKFTPEEVILEVRDFFGVEDRENGATGNHIDRGNEISHRPTVALLRPPHCYNLINQGWGNKDTWSLGKSGQSKAERNPIWYCYQEKGYYPSNADIYSQYVVSFTEKDPKEVEVYMPSVMDSLVPSNFLASRGRTIMPLLDRGATRQKQLDGMTKNVLYVSDRILPKDKTPKSASQVCEFAGRVCYAGFSGEVIEGDDKSPVLNNYVAFSQLVTHTQQASLCYQEADPSNPDDSEVVDTDGGIIRITGATNIVAMRAVGSSLLVFAENGVWQIIGGADYGFTAVNYQVVKISDRGCISPKSIVEVSESIFYWSGDGIYLLSGSEKGFYVGKDVTKASIKTLYNETSGRGDAFGVYDDYDKTVRWLASGQELVYRIDFEAWTKNYIPQDNIKLLSIVEVAPYISGLVSEDVTIDGVVVTSQGAIVTTSNNVKLDTKVESKYLAYDIANNKYTFSNYRNTSFVDYGTHTNPAYAIDAHAYMVGSHFTGGTGNKRKQSPYVTFHFIKTESGFDEEYEPIGASSCLVNVNWDWSNHQNANKSSREFQAYRFRRHYIPNNNLDGFNNGYETVVTKNKVRGSGKALSVTLKTEPLKDCQVIGWEQEFTVEQ